MNTYNQLSLENEIKSSWDAIAPFWPLKNLIAVNPLQGLEGLPFEQAVLKGAEYFQSDLPDRMEHVNRETIKWCQAYFDEGQATIRMPFEGLGFYKDWKKLAVLDRKLVKNKTDGKWLCQLSVNPELAIESTLQKMGFYNEDRVAILTLMLTTLPGWAAYLKYKTAWQDPKGSLQNPVTQSEYLAIRLIVTCLLCENYKTLLSNIAPTQESIESTKKTIDQIKLYEARYRRPLLKALSGQACSLNLDEEEPIADAQLAFCIDVRSEPFRRALESTGHYETYGVAGFFGLPIQVQGEQHPEPYASCPVLLKPAHTISEQPYTGDGYVGIKHKARYFFKQVYQSLKYNFTTPFALVELLGPIAGCYSAIKTFMPNVIETFKAGYINGPIKESCYDVLIDDISLEQQCQYAESVLKVMGLTKRFSKLVVFCGHGSTTKNNAYATALDCGACGGRHGAPNAKTLAKILNNEKVRSCLSKNDIHIPSRTLFLAGEHNTTTDDVALFYSVNDPDTLEQLTRLQKDLKIAGDENRLSRSAIMSKKATARDAITRSNDWAQVRPEWGLAKNAAFIVGPRALSKGINLEGRSFLHSYDYRIDLDGAALTAILTAPMVVAEWINMQYLFSSIDNAAYGGGNKITKNITGKIGIMQGNASDLMHGLPLQSVNISDKAAYHEPQRLMTIVYAPRDILNQIVKKESILQRLFQNEWVHLACIDPADKVVYQLSKELLWEVF